MKKILLGFSTIIALTISSVHAQNGIDIQLDGIGPDISGGTHTVNLYGGSPELVGGIYEVHFIVTNNTGADEQWRITRQKLNVPMTWVDQVCWPPLCYNTTGNTYITPNTGGNPAPIIVDGTSTTTNAELAELKPRITPDQSTASYALYRYYITEAATGIYVDSIDLEINYALSVNEIKPLSVSVAPNPSSDYININTTGVDNATLKMVDVLGNVVLSETLYGNSKKLDVNKFRNGIYFLTVESQGAKTVTRKIIVRH